MSAAPVRRFFGTLLFTIALLATITFLFVLFADAKNIPGVPGVPGTGELAPWVVATTIVLAVVAITLFLLLLIRKQSEARRQAEEAEAFFVPEDEESYAAGEEYTLPDDEGDHHPDIVVYDLAKVPTADHSWSAGEQHADSVVHPFHFPRNIDGGVYCNDYIDIGQDKRLKLSTVLAGPPDMPDAPQDPRPTPHEAATAEEEPVTTPEEAGGPTRSGSLMQERSIVTELEGRFDRPSSRRGAIHFDYPGEPMEVTELEPIGQAYAEKLKTLGIETTARLVYEEAAVIATRLGIDLRRVKEWQAMAELVKVNGIGPQYAEALAEAGVEGISELKSRSASTLAKQVNKHLEKQDDGPPAITENRIGRWQEAAKEMRRVRQKVPET